MAQRQPLPRISFGGGTLVLGAIVGVFSYAGFSLQFPRLFAVTLSILTALILIASVVAHELSHALVARMCGGTVREISVTFVGGHTRYEQGRIGPWGSLVISAVGPLSNGALALLFWLGSLLWFTDTVASTSERAVPALGALCLVSAQLNGALALFNSLPGLPLDGGRVLESLLTALGANRYRATFITGWIGRILAIVLVAVPLLASLAAGSAPSVTFIWALIVGGILFTGASEAMRHARWARRIDSVSLATYARPVKPYSPAMPASQERDFIAQGGTYVDAADRLYIPHLSALAHSDPAAPASMRNLPLESVVAVGPSLTRVPEHTNPSEVLATMAAANAGGALLVDAGGNARAVFLAHGENWP